MSGRIWSGRSNKTSHEDDPRNPATIADNVGDNVGDCAGMAADVFETYAVSLIGGVLVGYLTVAPEMRTAALLYPFVICGLAILASLIGIAFVNLVKLNPTKSLLGGVAVSGLVAVALFYAVTHGLFPAGLNVSGHAGLVTPGGALSRRPSIGVAMTFLVVLHHELLHVH